jgi:hypothetical protein
MTKTRTGTWLAEVSDDSLWDKEPYYPSLDEGSGMVLSGEWTDARWALLNHLSEELSNVTSQTCGPCEVVDPDGSFDRLETRLLGALKSLRRAAYGQAWEFETEGCRYRLLLAGRSEERLARQAEADAAVAVFSSDAFASWVSPQIAIFSDEARRRRPKHVGVRANGAGYRRPPSA